MSIEKLGQYFVAVEDPRCSGKVKHRLVEVLVIEVCAVIACAESWNDVALYGRSKLAERLLATWREASDPGAYAERLDALRESLLEGIALTEESAADIDPASKAETRQAAAVLASMRTAYEAMEQLPA